MLARQHFSSAFFAALVVCAAPSSVRAEFFGNVQGGTDFPQGALSFADAVVEYAPGIVGSNPSEPHRGPANALGIPDYDDPTGTLLCSSPETCTWVSLGDGGSLVLRFTDNVLTGSGDSAFDVWIFEVGGDIEDTFVAVSGDGVNWHPVGMVFGSSAGIDIDAYGFGTDARLPFVRLVDDTNEGEQNSVVVGSDIDSVGAISTVPITVPTMPGLALLASSVLIAGASWLSIGRSSLARRAGRER